MFFFVAISNCLPLHIPIQAFDVARGHLSSVDVARGRQSPQGPFSQRPGGGRGREAEGVGSLTYCTTPFG